MGTISVTLPSDGQTAEAADISTPLNTIVNEINGNLDNSNIATAAAIAGSKLADASITNAKLSTTAGEIGAAWQSWAPTLTNLTQGNGTLVAKYTQVGKTIKSRGSFTFGSTSSLSGLLTVSLPVTAASDYLFGTEIVGIGTTLNLSTQINPAVIKIQSDTTFRIAAITTVSGTNPVYTEIGSTREVSGTVPFTFGTGDVFTWNIEYEAA